MSGPVHLTRVEEEVLLESCFLRCLDEALRNGVRGGEVGRLPGLDEGPSVQVSVFSHEVLQQKIS